MMVISTVAGDDCSGGEPSVVTFRVNVSSTGSPSSGRFGATNEDWGWSEFVNVTVGDSLTAVFRCRH